MKFETDISDVKVALEIRKGNSVGRYNKDLSMDTIKFVRICPILNDSVYGQSEPGQASRYDRTTYRISEYVRTEPIGRISRWPFSQGGCP